MTMYGNRTSHTPPPSGVFRALILALCQISAPQTQYEARGRIAEGQDGQEGP